MFTGIVQTVGSVRSLASGRLVVQARAGAWEDPVQLGESVAVNGCCLTVASPAGALEFDLSEETLRRTALASLREGASVNLERALRPTDRMGGHFVQGHVDAVGELVSRRPAEGGEAFRFRIPEQGARYLVDKGSIALDGVSLTIVQPEGAEFDVWLVPHTLAATNLAGLAPGMKVNVEYDILAKTVLAQQGS